MILLPQIQIYQKMKQLFLWGFLISFAWMHAQNKPQQSLQQVVKGIVIDEWSGRPLQGVKISLENAEDTAALTDSLGQFRFDQIPIGRRSFKVQKDGYENGGVSNIEVTSSKEIELELKLKERLVQLQEVVVGGDRKTQAINRTAVVSARQFTVEEAVRYAGSRNDPSRMAQNFAGVSGGNDARNDIIIRGNSPAGILWRLDGVDIPNPNHYSTLGSTGGPVTILNTNTLKNSDFLSGAFPASYGNAMAGAFDLRMRNGNAEKHEFTGMMGFNGFEAGIEGPISKKSKASYLFNYRYSLVATLIKFGLNFGTGSATPYFQDMNFKINIPTKKSGTWSLFGFGGGSNIKFDALDNDNLYATPDGSLRDRKFESNTGFVGLSNQHYYNNTTFGKWIAAASTSQAEYKEVFYNTQPEQTAFYKKNVASKFIMGYTLQHKMNAKNLLTAGAFADLNVLSLRNDYIPDGSSNLFTFIDTRKNAVLYRTYFNWNYRFTDQLTTNLGVYGQYFDLNKKTSIEPRWNVKYQMKNQQTLSFGVGLHSQTQPLEVYFYQSKNSLGQIEMTNQNLDFVKSVHAVLGYDYLFTKNVRLKTEAYVQSLYNAAVEQTPSSFSMLNSGSDFYFPDKTHLVNQGKGYNYGVEITLERFLNRGIYYLFTASVFESKYKGSDDVWRNTAYNSNYITNALIGKEFYISEKSTFGIDTKVTFAGGQRYTPFDIAASQTAGYVLRQTDRAYSEQNPAYFRWDLKLSYTRNVKKYTQKWYIDFQNLTNQKNLYVRNLNPAKGTISDINQIGFFPNINYKITF